MKILSIAKFIIIRNLRNVAVMLIMCAMPLVIIFFLGLAFEDSMGTAEGISIDEMNISYYVEGKKGELSEGFEEFVNSISDETNMTEVSNLEDELEQLKLNKLTAVVVVDEEDDEIILYKNTADDTESSLFEGMLRTYINRHSVIIEIIKVNPMVIEQVIDRDIQDSSYTVEKSINTKLEPGSMDYYGVAMLILFALYVAMTPMYSVQEDNSSGRTDRISTSNIKGSQLFIGNMLGFVIHSVIQIAIVAVISYLAFDVYWGTQPLFPLLTIVSLIICMTSFGVFLGSAIKSESAASPIMHIFIVASAFFGGAYVPVSEMGALGEIGKYFSLIWWANTGIQKSIYSNDNSYLIMANLIFITVAIILTIINSMIFRKRRMR